MKALPPNHFTGPSTINFLSPFQRSVPLLKAGEKEPLRVIYGKHQVLTGNVDVLAVKGRLSGLFIIKSEAIRELQRHGQNV